MQPTDLGVRFSFETPDVHFDQDWTVTYEGALPGFDGASPATLSTPGRLLVRSSSRSRRRASARRASRTGTVGAERANADLATRSRRRARRPSGPSRSPHRRLRPGHRRAPSARAIRTGTCQDDAPVLGREPGRTRHASTRARPCSVRSVRAEPLDARLPDPRGLRRPPRRRTGSTGPAGQTRDRLQGRRRTPRQLKARCGAASTTRCTFKRPRGAREWVTVGSTGRASRTTSRAATAAVASSRAIRARRSSTRARRRFRPRSARRSPRRYATARSRCAIRCSRSSSNGRNRHGRSVARRATWSGRFPTRGEFSALVDQPRGEDHRRESAVDEYIESLGQIAVVDAASQGLVLIDLAGRHHCARAVLLTFRASRMSKASGADTPVMRQFLAGEGGAPGRAPLLPARRLLRALLRRRGRRGEGARPHADEPQQVGGRADPDGGRAAPRGERVRPAAPRSGLQGRDLRADGRPVDGEGHRPARGRARRDAGARLRRRGRRRAEEPLPRGASRSTSRRTRRDRGARSLDG